MRNDWQTGCTEVINTKGKHKVNKQSVQPVCAPVERLSRWAKVCRQFMTDQLTSCHQAVSLFFLLLRLLLLMNSFSACVIDGDLPTVGKLDTFSPLSPSLQFYSTENLCTNGRRLLTWDLMKEKRKDCVCLKENCPLRVFPILHAFLVVLFIFFLLAGRTHINTVALCNALLLFLRCHLQLLHWLFFSTTQSTYWRVINRVLEWRKRKRRRLPVSQLDSSLSSNYATRIAIADWHRQFSELRSPVIIIIGSSAEKKNNLDTLPFFKAQFSFKMVISFWCYHCCW